MMKYEDSTDSPFEDLVRFELEQIGSMLISKNKKYGNSALDPVRVFSKASSQEQILVRIDDKLSRIKNRTTEEDEDVIKDLIGYLILLQVSKKEQNNGIQRR